jgi:hypothetical protein
VNIDHGGIRGLGPELAGKATGKKRKSKLILTRFQGVYSTEGARKESSKATAIELFSA